MYVNNGPYETTSITPGSRVSDVWKQNTRLPNVHLTRLENWTRLFFVVMRSLYYCDHGMCIQTSKTRVSMCVCAYVQYQAAFGVTLDIPPAMFLNYMSKF